MKRAQLPRIQFTSLSVNWVCCLHQHARWNARLAQVTYCRASRIRLALPNILYPTWDFSHIATTGKTSFSNTCAKSATTSNFPSKVGNSYHTSCGRRPFTIYKSHFSWTASFTLGTLLTNISPLIHPILSVLDLSAETGIHPNDIVSTLQFHRMMRYYKGKHIILTVSRVFNRERRKHGITQ